MYRGGIIASAEGTSLVGGVKLGGSETLFSALVMRYVSEKSTSNECEKLVKRQGFSVLTIISEVLLV